MPTPRQQIEQQVDWAISKGQIPATDRQKHIEFLSSNQDFYASALAGGAHFTQKAQQMAEERRRVEAELAEARRKLEAERAEMSAWGRDARAELDRANALQEEHRRLVEENARFRQLAKDYNIENEVPQIERPQPVPAYRQNLSERQTPPRDPNTGLFLSRDEGEQFAQGVINMTSGAMAAAAEHFALFGQPLADNIMQEALAAGEPDVKAYWERKHNVAAKRAEMDERKRNEDIERIRAEERQKLLGEMAIDPSRFGTPGQTYQPQNSPLADAYMHSRAAEINPVAGTEGTTALAPEKRSDIATHRERVAAGAAAFTKHFNADGSLRAGVKPPSSWAPVQYEGV